MLAKPDILYYRERERHERAMAMRAVSPPIRLIHEEMAARYHGLALALEFDGSASEYIADREAAHIAPQVDRRTIG